MHLATSERSLDQAPSSCLHLHSAPAHLCLFKGAWQEPGCDPYPCLATATLGVDQGLQMLLECTRPFLLLLFVSGRGRGCYRNLVCLSFPTVNLRSSIPLQKKLPCLYLQASGSPDLNRAPSPDLNRVSSGSLDHTYLFFRCVPVCVHVYACVCPCVPMCMCVHVCVLVCVFMCVHVEYGGQRQL